MLNKLQSLNVSEQWELSGNMFDWTRRDRETRIVLVIVCPIDLSSHELDGWLIMTRESENSAKFQPEEIVFSLNEALRRGEGRVQQILDKHTGDIQFASPE